MIAKLLRLLGAAGKALLTVALIASFIFIGWRIWTRNAYIAHEKEQCAVLAAGAALSSAESALADEALLRQLQKNETLLYTTDHMKLPGNYNIKVTLSLEGAAVKAAALAESGWNSRSPQKSEASVLLKKKGKAVLMLPKQQKEAEELLFAASNGNPVKTVVFCYPFERKCPAPYKLQVVSCRLKGESFYSFRAFSEKTASSSSDL